MRQSLFWLSLVVLLLVAETAHAASGRVIKVLPHYLDLKGHHTLSPGLYERDAYQAHLRQHPEQRSGIRFDVQWRTSGAVWEPLQVRVELRGIAHGALEAGADAFLTKPCLPEDLEHHIQRLVERADRA